MMNNSQHHNKQTNGHRIGTTLILCLFGLCLCMAVSDNKKGRTTPKEDNLIYLEHSDELHYDQFGPTPDAQIVRGNVHFIHQGGHLWCDSAYFYQMSNSVNAYGHVRFKQGDTLSLSCDRAYYDGQLQLLQAVDKVVLKHNTQTLYTDSLDYDRLYDHAHYYNGGKLVDGEDQLVSDWCRYDLNSRIAVFYYDVTLKGKDRLVTTDTLYYNTREKSARVTGPSLVASGSSTINTTDGTIDMQTDRSALFNRSTVIDKEKSIVADTIYHDKSTGQNDGFGNVVYIDTLNKHMLTCGEAHYNEKTGYGYATQRALAKDYSQKDTLYVHADTFKIITYNMDTDSVYREGHAYSHVRAFRNDIQAVCDSMVFTSVDSCLTLYKDPVAWNGERQLLGEMMKVYMNDSTIRMAQVIGQALSIEHVENNKMYNQVSSKQMDAYFVDGNLRRVDAHGNVKIVYFPYNDSDSAYVGLNYTETDTLRMYLSATRQMERIWMNKHKGILYPMTQIPPDRYRLPEYAWFEEMRPKDPDDVFNWRGKGSEAVLKKIERHNAPLQKLAQKEAVIPEEPEATENPEAPEDTGTPKESQ